MKKKRDASALQTDGKDMDKAMCALAEDLAENTGILVHVAGKIHGRSHWAYALISPVNYPAFLGAQQRGGYDLAEYASEILETGKGKSPPAGTLDRIKKNRPDLNFDVDAQLRAAISP